MGDCSLAATQRRRGICVMGRRMKGKQKQQVASGTTSLSKQYEPRVFQEIVGHGIVVKTLSNAVRHKKVAPLYLFHGPNGTGKTSTARVFAMALNCQESTKPPCKPCSTRSLYTIHQCSANTTFHKIRTLLHNTSLAQVVQVLIIRECHLLTADAWEELMYASASSSGSSTLVVVLLTTDANSIAGNISSRCHRFYFNKLSDEDVAQKLSTILVHESMDIEKEAFKLIVAKSQGSLRDAENILDQLALLGTTTITTSLVQHLVGLIPESKLLELLAAAVAGDTINTIKHVKKLSECVEAASFLSQLATLITNILSDSSWQLNKSQSARLCYILKLLVKTESQLRASNDKTNSCMIAAFLDMITSPDEKCCMEKVWKDVVNGVESSHTQKFLQDQAKLASLCISRSNATIHLTFTRQEDKMAAEISEESLAKALEVAIGCPVTLHMNLSGSRWNARQSSALRLTKSKSCSTSQPSHTSSLSKGRDLTRMFENLPNTNRPRHRWLSLSSIPHSDASVEPYSQDVIYENSNKDGDDTLRKNPKFSKTSKDRRFREPAADQLQSNPALCSIDICC